MSPLRRAGRNVPHRTVRKLVGGLRILQRRFRSTGIFYVWVLAVLVGGVAGVAAVGFHRVVIEIQVLAYGLDDTRITSLRSLPWWQVVGIPVGAGLIVGALIQWLSSKDRAEGIADVIRARDLTRGRVRIRDGVVTAAVAAVSLGGGASTGREGPVVHLMATFSSAVARLLHADERTSRTLLGCAAAAGVSALFNAPVAGTLFALEVVLGSYSIRVFAPIVAASATGTVVSRTIVGNHPTFPLEPFAAESLWHLPAFAVLGIMAAVAAVVFANAIFVAERAGDRAQAFLHLPLFLRPAVAGLGLGALGWAFPEVVGVGYATTTAALEGNLLLQTVLVVLLAKLLAVAVSFAGRFGGGVFSPSLMLGALLGLAFGQILGLALPGDSVSTGTYALAGMAGVSAVMLGAPISTTLIAFELTGDYRTALAVMVTVSVATLLAQRFLHRSFFYEQLEREGLPLAGGRHEHLIRTLTAAEVLRPTGETGAAPGKKCARMIAAGLQLAPEASLKTVLDTLQHEQREYLPVVSGEGRLLGAVFHSDALRIYTRSLADSYSEEHDC